jgi:hypothetical protein
MLSPEAKAARWRCSHETAVPCPVAVLALWVLWLVLNLSASPATCC